MILEELKINEIDKEVIIYGCGEYGKAICVALKYYGIVPRAFIDNIKTGEWEGIPIIHSSSVEEYRRGKIIIAKMSNYEGTEEELKANGIEVLYTVIDLFKNIALFEDRLQKIGDTVSKTIETYRQFLVSKVRDEVYIPSVAIMVTEKCTLNCENCMGLATYYEKSRRYSFEEIEINMDRLLEVVDRIGNIGFLHEPLTFKELNRFIEKYATHPKVESIRVITNGTIVPSNQIIDSIKHEKVRLYINNYGECSVNITKIIDKLKEYGVEYTIRTELDDGEWSEVLVSEMKSSKSRDIRCGHTCITMIQNRLYYCMIGANAVNVGLIPDTTTDYIDLSMEDKESLKKHIKQYLSSNVALDACQYCKFDIENGKIVERAKQKIKS